MPLHPLLPVSSRSEELAALRAALSPPPGDRATALAFGVPALDDRLSDRGLAGAGLHEIAALRPSLGDDAAATLFAAGLAARFAARSGECVIWALSKFDLYAPGLAQVGLAPGRVVYVQAGKDRDVLATAEDAVRDGSVGCVVAEVKRADRTATRRLQLAASDGGVPILLYRRHRARDRCPLDEPSAAMTRWRIGCVASARLPYPGVGRARWTLDLVRQRNGNPFSLEVDACDDQGCLALPSAAADRTVAAPARQAA